MLSAHLKFANKIISTFGISPKNNMKSLYLIGIHLSLFLISGFAKYEGLKNGTSDYLSKTIRNVEAGQQKDKAFERLSMKTRF